MMHIELLENCGGERFPEELDCTLDLQMANASCCRFNRWGTLVAVGATDGRIFIIDFQTKGVVRTISAHTQLITCLSWSRDGCLLLSASADTTVVLWEVLTSTTKLKLKYSSMIMSASFNPRNANQFFVQPANAHPVVETREPRETKILTTDHPLTSDDLASCVSFDRRGKYLITGTGKGRIVIYHATTFKLVTIVKQPSVQQIRNIVVPRRGSFILTNSQDRVIRRYDMDELIRAQKGLTLEPIQKLSDIVNKAAWKAVCCSFDGEYICGASTKSHSLHVWERATGSLVKILHGTKGESLHDVQWHPSRAVILSVANGIVSVWTQAQVENWSAFAPDFTELEENTRYKEKEGEFDAEDEDAIHEDNDDASQDSDIEIDVVNMKSADLQCSSDEDDYIHNKPVSQGGPLWYIPVVPEFEHVDASLNAQHGPFADTTFLSQPVGGGILHYDPSDIRSNRATGPATATSFHQVVKASRRPTK